ncbi:hypothetical protein PANT111_150142 [Pantoea brenneri]|uniref:Uncharacterized protein n=1 Tax=Pantoea brenneri TaxID=472694 RepID=A0AAX3J3S2_9GAMM|nr:hypothetical protein PANT111_150142 [Pantoea brenneri]
MSAPARSPLAHSPLASIWMWITTHRIRSALASLVKGRVNVRAKSNVPRSAPLPHP